MVRVWQRTEVRRYARQPEDRRAAIRVPGQLNREFEHDREQAETRATDDGHEDVQDHVVVGFDYRSFQRCVSASATG